MYPHHTLFVVVVDPESGEAELVRRGANPDANTRINQMNEEEKEQPLAWQRAQHRPQQRAQHHAQQRVDGNPPDRMTAELLRRFERFDKLQIPFEHLGRSATVHSGLSEANGSRHQN